MWTLHPTIIHSLKETGTQPESDGDIAKWGGGRERGREREKRREYFITQGERQTDRQTYHQLRRVLAVVAIVRRFFGDGVRQIRGKIVQRLKEQVHLLLTECL